MNEHTCGKCGGVYRDPQADGSAYVHVCPPPRPPAAPAPSAWERARAKLRAIWAAVKEG